MDKNFQQITFVACIAAASAGYIGASPYAAAPAVSIILKFERLKCLA
jgi:hypothetical protein